jgi:hypothetical protein
MPRVELPNDFTWTWDEATVRVEIPPMVETAQHVYETVLTRADAARLADAVWDRATEGGRSGPLRAPTRIDLVHDARYGESTLSSFRAKLVAALEGKGLKPEVVLVTAGGRSEELDSSPMSSMLEPSSKSSPMLEPSSKPAPPSLPSQPSVPASFDPASDTDLGLGSEFDEVPEKPSPSTTGETGRPAAPKPADRGSRQGSAPVSKRRADKKK